MPNIIQQVNSRFDMTPREALVVQERQLKYYEAQYPSLRAAASAANNLEGIDLDDPLPIQEINRRIPRGFFLGVLIGQAF